MFAGALSGSPSARVSSRAHSVDVATVGTSTFARNEANIVSKASRIGSAVMLSAISAQGVVQLFSFPCETIAGLRPRLSRAGDTKFAWCSSNYQAGL